MQLNAARKRQSATFESKTMRDSFMSDVIRKLEEPGNDSNDDSDVDGANDDCHKHLLLTVIININKYSKSS